MSQRTASITPWTVRGRSEDASRFDGSPGDASPSSSGGERPASPASSPSSAPASSPAPTSSPSPIATAPEPRRYLPLSERVPKVQTVLDVIRSSVEVQNMLEMSSYFSEKSSQQLLLDVDFWEDVAISMHNAILECSTDNKKEVTKMTTKYRGMKAELLYSIGSHDIFDGEGSSIGFRQRHEAKIILQLIGMEFMGEFQRLIKSSWGDVVLSIPEQIEAEVKAALDLPLDKLFGDDVRLSEHAYYVIGFLCHAGMKERDRRTKKNDIGECIGVACSHFLAADDPNLDALRMRLPTGLVDQRIASGGLKYPNEKFYRVFGAVELSYSRSVTPDNFISRGGTLLCEIRDALMQNEQVFASFSSLLDGHEYSDDTISKALEYFLKVFCNLRGKDVALKYNSNLNGSNTVGLRQTLAGGINLGKSKKKGRRTQQPDDKSDYSKMKVAELKAILESRGLPKTGVKAVLIQRLEDDDGDDDEDVGEAVPAPSREVLHEDEDDLLDEEGQHSAMMAAVDAFDAERDDDYHSAEKVSDKDVIGEKADNDM